MIEWHATRRRWLLIALALTASAWLTRGQISTMLVARGDSLAFAGDARAQSMYERALFFDAGNAVAADRLIFAAILSHDRSRIRAAIAVADRQMALHPANDTIEMDRALCLQLVGDARAALRDFADVGERARDPRALLFAADDARKLGRIAAGRRFLRIAAAFDPEFRPVRSALARAEARR